MSVSHARLGSGFIASLIYENLGAVLTEDRSVLVLEEALVHAGLRSIPRDGSALREFLERHLTGTLAAAIDPSAARAVVAQIISVLPKELLGEPGDEPDEVPSPAPPPDERATGRSRDDLEVIIVTASDGAFSRIARRFAPTAMITRHHRLESMSSTFVDPVLLIDARSMTPGTDPRHEVAGRDVLLWGADAWSPKQVEWIFSRARSVTRCPGEVEAEDLSAICSALRLEATSAR